MGISKQFKELQSKADRLRNKKIDLYMEGEHGTGRDYWINYIHGNPPEKIDCRSWREDLSILSSSEPMGTSLYFDSIEHLDSEGQAFLLRAIEKRNLLLKEKAFAFENLFFSSTPAIYSKLSSGQFREDVFKKLSAVKISIPPLRERKSDIAYYTDEFIDQINKNIKRRYREVSENLQNFLLDYPWDGNLSELYSFLESMILFSKGSKLEKRNIPASFKQKKNSFTIDIPAGFSMREYEKAIILKNLIHTGKNRRLTAEILEISERNLYRKINEYNIEI